jgi:tetratricopeptide (TPR) repeat protein
MVQAPRDHHPSLPADTPLSLLAVIGISDEALDEESSRVLRVLSVFPSKPDSFSEEAALAVTATSTETIDNVINYGLLESSGSGRYTMHQTIVDYARKKLDELPDKTIYYKRMAEFFLSYVKAHKTDYDKLNAEHANVTCAIKWAAKNWRIDKTGEIVKLLNEVVQRWADFLGDRGNLAERIELGQEALKVAEVLNDQEAVSRLCASTIGWALLQQGKYNEATRYSKKGRTAGLAAGNGALYWAGLAAWNLGSIARDRKDPEKTEYWAKEALRLCSQSRHPKSGMGERIANVLLGFVALMKKNAREAERLFRQVYDSEAKSSNPVRTANRSMDIAHAVLSLGDTDAAYKIYIKALEVGQENGSPMVMAEAESGLGMVERARGNDAEAQKCLDAAKARFASIGIDRPGRAEQFVYFTRSDT